MGEGVASATSEAPALLALPGDGGASGGAPTCVAYQIHFCGKLTHARCNGERHALGCLPKPPKLPMLEADATQTLHAFSELQDC